MAEETLELVEGKPLTTANAPSFAAHQRAMGRGTKTEPTPPVEKQAPAESAGVIADDSEGKPESAAVSETAKENHQEKPEEKRDRSLRARVKELISSGRIDLAEKLIADNATKSERERAEKAERELAELRKAGTRKPEEKPAEAKTEAAKPAETAGKPKPKLSDFENDPKYKTYGDALEAYNDARDAWKEEQAQVAKQASERQTAYEARTKPWREKHPDIEEKIQSAMKAMPDLTNFGMEVALKNLEFADHSLLGDVLYELASDHAEYRRIASLSPAEAHKEVQALAARLSGTSTPTKPPEVTKTPQTRTPQPPVVVNGAGNPSLSTAGAKNWREHNLARGRKDGTAAGA